MPTPRLRFPSTSLSGVLGVVPSDQEVVGVFPQLSSTTIPHEQEIRIRRGDTLNLGIQIQNDDDPPDPVSLLTSVMRFAVRQGPGVPRSQLAPNQLANDDALIYKRSYLSSEIEFPNASNGEAIIHVRPSDTRDLPQVPTLWDLELTRRVDLLTTTDLKANLVMGSPVIQSVGFNWTDFPIDDGDMIEIQGKLVLIIDVLNAAQLRVDFQDWTGATHTDFCLYTGDRKTVASGPFTSVGDVAI